MNFNKNRLQFVHCDTLFNDIESVKKYVANYNDMNQYRPSLYAEPMVFKYGEEDNPNIVLVIGSKGDGEASEYGFFYIDINSIESSIKEISEQVNGSETEIADITGLVRQINASCGFDENTGNYQTVDGDDILADATTLAEADNLLADSIRALAAAYKLSVTNTDTITLSKKEDAENGVTITANVNVPSEHMFDGVKSYAENIILISSEDEHNKPGLFASVELKQEENILSFIVNGETKTTIEIPQNKFVESGVYDKEREMLVYTYTDGTTFDVDVKNLINEWNVLEEGLQKGGVILSKDPRRGLNLRDTGVEDWQDVLSARIKFSEHPKNLATIADDGGLYVFSDASMMTYKDKESIESVIEKLEENCIAKDAVISKAKGNIIEYSLDGGVYASVKFNYDENSNKLTYTLNGEEQTWTINSINIINSITYDSKTEELVIIYEAKGSTSKEECRIPFGQIIDEVNYKDSQTVQLVLNREVAGESQLTAHVKISGLPDNIIETQSDGIFVSGKSDNIKHGEKTVKEVLDSVFESLQKNQIIQSADKTVIVTETENGTTLKVNIDEETIRTSHGDKEGQLYVPYQEGYLHYGDKGFEVVGIDEAINNKTEHLEQVGSELIEKVETVVNQVSENTKAIEVASQAVANEQVRAEAKETELENVINTNNESINSLNEKVSDIEKTVAKNEVTSQDNSITLANLDGKTDLSVAVDGLTIQKKDGKLYSGLHLGVYAENLPENVKEAYALYDGNNNIIDGSKVFIYKDTSYGSGLTVENRVVKVKIDEASEAYLTVSENGVKLVGISDAIKAVSDKAIANENAISAVDEKSNTNKEAIDALRVDVNNEIKDRTTEVARVEKRIDDNVENLKHLIEDASSAALSEISRVETQCDSRYESLSEKVDSVEKQVNANQVTVSPKEDGFIKVKVDKSENTGSVVTISENGDIASKAALEKEVSDRVANIDAVNANIAQLSKDVVAAKTKVIPKSDGHISVNTVIDDVNGNYVVTITEDNIASVTGTNSLASVKSEIVGDELSTSHETIYGLKKYLEDKISTDIDNSKLSSVNAINITDKVVKLVINSESDEYLTQDENGLKLSGVKTAIESLQTKVENQPSYTFVDTSTVAVGNNNGTLTYDVKLSSSANNILEAKADGLYTTVSLTYDETSNTLTFNGDKIQLNAGSVISSMDYIDGNIVITYLPANSEEIKTVSFDASKLFKALQVSNGKTGIDLTLAEAENGGQILSAVINIANKDTNMLKLVNGELEVDDSRVVAVEESVKDLNDSNTLINNEITTIKGNLNTVITDVNTFNTKSNDLTQRVSSLETEILEINTISGVTETLARKIDEVKTKTEANTSAIDELKTSVNQEVSNRNAAISEAKLELEGKLNTEIATRASETARLSETVTNISSNLDKEKSDRETAIASLTTSVTAIDSNLGVVREDVSANKKAIDTLELHVYGENGLEGQMTNVQSKLSVLEEKVKKVDTIETLVTSVDARLTAEIENRTNADNQLREKIEILTKEVDSSKESNTQLVEKMTKLEEENAELKKQVADLIETVKNLFDDGIYSSI